jgi:hypothetical protein
VRSPKTLKGLVDGLKKKIEKRRWEDLLEGGLGFLV